MRHSFILWTTKKGKRYQLNHDIPLIVQHTQYQRCENVGESASWKQLNIYGWSTLCSSRCDPGLCAESTTRDCCASQGRLPGGGGIWAGGQGESSKALNSGVPHDWSGDWVASSGCSMVGGQHQELPSPMGSQGRTPSGTGSKSAAGIQCRVSPYHRDPINPQIKELLFSSSA